MFFAQGCGFVWKVWPIIPQDCSGAGVVVVVTYAVVVVLSEGVVEEEVVGEGVVEGGVEEVVCTIIEEEVCAADAVVLYTAVVEEVNAIVVCPAVVGVGVDDVVGGVHTDV